MTPYLGWIIALIVLGMMAYPIMQLVPNKSQQRQMAFRQAALRRGLKVQVRQPELPPELSGHQADMPQAVAYFKPAPSSLTQTCLALKSPKENDWFWINNRRPPANLMTRLLPAFNQLPAFCLAVEQGPAGSSIFLVDSLECEQIETLDQALDTLNSLIAP